MAAIPENWPALLEPGLRAIFEDQFGVLTEASKIPTLFNVNPSDKEKETDFSIGAFGEWKEYKGKIDYDDNDPGFEKEYLHVEYARGFSVERKLVRTDQYNKIRAMPKGLATAAMRKRENDAADVFNEAFNTVHSDTGDPTVGGDAVALCSDSHPHSPANSATTQDNAGSSALSEPAVIETRRLMKTFTDDRDQLIVMNPDTLIVPRNLESQAWKIWHSNQVPGGMDNDANFVPTFVDNVVVWDYLDDNDNWFMADSAYMNMFLNWFDLDPLEFAFDPTGEYNLKANYRGYMTYSRGWSDWRWVYGHEV